MKKKIFAIIYSLILVASISVPVFAAEDDSDAELNYITDAVGILTDTEVISLEATAAEITEEHACSIYVVVVDDYVGYTNYDEGVMDCATEIFDDYNLGYGEDENGILLLLSMDDRDYALVAHGSKAHGAFTDYGKYVLADEFLDDFSVDDWGGGFEDYLKTADDFLTLYESGTPVDTNPEDYDGRYDEQYEQYFGKDYGGMPFLVKLLLTFVLPIAIAFVAVLIFKGRMKSVFLATSAARYADEDSLVIDDEWDRFSHITEIVIPKPDSDNNKSSYGGGLGGGGTTIGSGGFSGHGGKF